MPDDSPLSVPEFNTVFDSHVYSIDFLASEHLDMDHPDPNVLRRGFLVLGRYSKPAVSELSAYLQQIIPQHLPGSSKNTFDPQFSPLIANLRDQDIMSLLKGDQEKAKAFASSPEEIGKQYLDVHYFTVPAPLYVQQGKKTAKLEWYHDAFNDADLRQNGLQRWFLIRMEYTDLLQPTKVIRKIKKSSVLDKEATIYVMENICRIFSPFPHFARIKDITSTKIREAALETLVHLQKENNSSSAFYRNSKGIVDVN